MEARTRVIHFALHISEQNRCDKLLKLQHKHILRSGAMAATHLRWRSLGLLHVSANSHVISQE